MFSNRDINETIAKFVLAADSPAVSELMLINRSMADTVQRLALNQSPVLTIPVPADSRWKPVPAEFVGDVVYTIKGFVIDPIAETPILIANIGKALAGLANPARKHTISFELGVELPPTMIDLALFDGCRYLRIVGDYTIPDFQAVERLHIIPQTSVAFMGPLAGVSVLGIPCGCMLSRSYYKCLWCEKRSGIHCTYMFLLAELHCKHVYTHSIPQRVLAQLPNISPGYALTCYTESIAFEHQFGARSLTGSAEYASRFRHLQHAHLWSAGDQLRLLNFAEFGPVVIPHVDFRVPVTTYNRLESVILADDNIEDIDCLSTITDLNICSAPKVTRLPIHNRITKLKCKSTFDGFRQAPGLRELSITGNYTNFNTSRLAGLQITSLDLSNVDSNYYLEIPASVTKLELKNVSCESIKTGALLLELNDVTVRKWFDAESAVDISVDKTSGRSKFVLRSPEVTTLYINSWSYNATPASLMTKLQTVRILGHTFDFGEILLMRLKSLHCKAVDSASQTIRFDHRFPDLTDIRLQSQTKSVEICKPLAKVHIRLPNQRAHVLITKDCERAYIYSTSSLVIMSGVKIGHLHASNILEIDANPEVTIGTLEINMTFERELQVAAINSCIKNYRFTNLSITGLHVTADINFGSLPVVSFINCTFALDTFKSPTGVKYILVNTAGANFKHMSIPVYNSSTGQLIHSPVLQ